jgi:hypothetical protein
MGEDLALTVHLVKLCVGVDSVGELAAWQRDRVRAMRKRGAKAELAHTTRMVPKRVDELLDGGSLYWVIRGVISVRQRLIAIRPFRDKEGVGRCHLVYSPRLVLVSPRPRRAFQGWRYLDVKDAPPDIGKADLSMPDELRRELADLGLR